MRRVDPSDRNRTVDERTDVAEFAGSAPAVDSHGSATKPSRILEPLHEADLLAKLFWTVAETAFMCRVGVRTVWRMVSDPKSGFPRPRRVRRRTLLARDEVLAFMAGGTSR